MHNQQSDMIIMVWGHFAAHQFYSLDFNWFSTRQTFDGQLHSSALHTTHNVIAFKICVNANVKMDKQTMHEAYAHIRIDNMN